MRTETITTSATKKKVAKFALHHKSNYKKTNRDLIFEFDEDLNENFTIIPYDKTAADFSEISTILKSHFLFYNLDEFQTNQIVNNMFRCKTKEGEYLFKQNSMGHAFFLIVEGEVEVIINKEVKCVLGKGTYFGDLALIYNAPRSASIKAKSNVTMWAITRDIFQRLVRELKLKQYK